MELLPSFFQLGTLEILVVLTFLLPFCDSVHALAQDFASNNVSFPVMIEHARSIHNELYTLLKINTGLFLCLLLITFSVRYFAIPMIQRIDDVLDRVYKSVHKLLLEGHDAVYQFVNGHATLSARLSRIETALTKKTRVMVKVGSNRRAKILGRQLKCAKRHLSKRTVEAICNTTAITNLTAENCAIMDVLPILIAIWAKVPERLPSKVQRYALIENQLEQIHNTHRASNDQYICLYEEVIDAFEKYCAELKTAGGRVIELEEKWFVVQDQCTKLNKQLDEVIHDAEGYQEGLKAKTEDNIKLINKIYELTSRNSSLEQAALNLSNIVVSMQTSLCDLQKKSPDFQGMITEPATLENADNICIEAITRLQSNEFDLQQQLLESNTASKESLRQKDEQMTHMATAYAEALKARDDENTALEQRLAGCQSIKEQQAAEAVGRFITSVTQKDAEIAVGCNDNTTLRQQLVHCQALAKKNAVGDWNQITAITTQKDAEIELIRQQARDQIASGERTVSSLQAELATLRRQASNYQAMKEMETESILSQVSAEYAEKEKELENLRSESAFFASKVATLEKLRKKPAKQSASQTKSITIFEAASTAPQQIQSTTQEATEGILELTKQLESKSAYLEAAYIELDSIKREWSKTYPVIQDSNDN